MNIKLVPLLTWIESECGNGSPSKKKEEAAFILGVGIATIYRWVKEGNVFIEEYEASIGGDDAAVSVWEHKKIVE